MRQRRIKDLEEKTAAHEALIIAEPTAWKGRWREAFVRAAESAGRSETSPAIGPETSPAIGPEGGPPSGGEIYMEIGCGKGRFITTLAERNPDKLYIAVEGAESVVLRALEKATEKKLKNLVFITQYVDELSEFFQRGELAGIYLNFSDPWPKDRHAKRRLTHTRYLESYKEILLPGSFLEFKTDNDGLFAFSVPEFEANGLEIVERTDDLHRSNYAAKEVETEYEHKFRLLGSRIHYCKARI